MRLLPPNLALACVLFGASVLGAPAVAGPSPTYALSTDTMVDNHDWRRGTPAAWRYAPGDDMSWAGPDFDDTTWTVVNPLRSGEWIERPDWRGVGWFRLWVEVAPDLRDQSLAVWFAASGAAELYVDGRLIRKRGDIQKALAGATPAHRSDSTPSVLTLPRARHLLAVRFASPEWARMQRPGFEIAFRISFSDAGPTLALWQHVAATGHEINLIFVGEAIGLALLHLLLFGFYREKKENLYHAIATFSAAGIAYFAMKGAHAPTLAGLEVFNSLFQASIVLTSLFGLRFYYEVFVPQRPRRFWVFTALAVPLLLFCWRVPKVFIYGFAVLCFVEQLHVLIRALVRRLSGAWIVAVGGGLSIVGAVATILYDTQVVRLAPPFAYVFGFMALLFSISIYLARNIAHDKRALAEQLVRVQTLSELSINQEREAREEAIARQALEEENKRQELLLEEASKREAVLRQLELTNVELKQTQARLVQNEKMAALGRLVAGVAHEFNTPMGAIQSTCDSQTRALEHLRSALQQGAGDERKAERALKALGEANRVISDGSARVSEIVKRLRSFARLDEADLNLADVHEGIEDALMLLNHRLGERIKVTKHFAELPRIACYGRQLNQAFSNLLTNAIEAIDGEGEIEIVSRQQGDEVQFSVRDSGAGIAPDDLERIFDPGFTTRGVGVGAGLGLSICHQVVQAHHGRIEVDSDVGKGTTVTLTLPTNLAFSSQAGAGA